jgi:transcriptional regulator with XRE-family HTH domain
MKATEGEVRRIKLLRRMHRMNQIEFARYIGVRYKRWNHYECGYPMTRETAIALRARIKGLSIDWLWWGDTTNMPRNLMTEIRRIEREDGR